MASGFEDGGLLGVGGNTPRRSTSYSRAPVHKGIIIASAIVVAFVVIGVTTAIAVELAKDKDHKIERVPLGLSKIAGTDVWTAGKSDPVIVILPDIYGLGEDVKGIAKSFSEKGFTAIVIDYFNGNISIRPPANVSLLYSTNVIQQLYARGYKSIQSQGYCYGGRVGTSLCSAQNLTRTCVVAHPSSLVDGDAALIVKPMFFEMPAIDNFNSKAPYFNTTLAERGIPAKFKIYPNTTHGFAVNGINPEQKKIALEDSIEWFIAHK